jgi:hypothetical protein
MKFSAFSAVCPFEIGDKARDISGNVLEITDIASVHYLKKQTVEFGAASRGNDGLSKRVPRKRDSTAMRRAVFYASHFR